MEPDFTIYAPDGNNGGVDERPSFYITTDRFSSETAVKWTKGLAGWAGESIPIGEVLLPEGRPRVGYVKLMDVEVTRRGGPIAFIGPMPDALDAGALEEMVEGYRVVKSDEEHYMLYQRHPIHLPSFDDRMRVLEGLCLTGLVRVVGEVITHRGEDLTEGSPFREWITLKLREIGIVDSKEIWDVIQMLKVIQREWNKIPPSA